MDVIEKPSIIIIALRRFTTLAVHYIFATGFWSIAVASVFQLAHSDLIPTYSIVTLLLGALLAFFVPLDFSQKRDQAAEGSLSAVQSASGASMSNVSSSDWDSSGEGGDGGD